ncbi:GTP-binding domain [Mycobacterium phage Bask21]|uniref:DprA-like DNA processing chain A n=1 Tax=Mycobacterium phage Bask21 TaxID=2902889 RepID=G1D0S6_9CAUD|nr:GTP-binding domain [Mycobacterium phage Bask21]AEK08375.1 hypothetical protein PBI_BASK21_76 [Mycobacterium phage Bask21]AYR00189.1 DNA binding protein [Mycobacterium phage Pat3]
MTRVVLVTGSRDLTEEHIVHEELYTEARKAGGLRNLTVRHGGATGADHWAHTFCVKHPEVTEDEVKADWNRDCTGQCFHGPRYKDGKPYCPVAGVLRNQAMVDKGADITLAFPRGQARGTNDCIRRAKKAQIPVVVR